LTHRERFVQVIERLRGQPVLWASKGPSVFDCSGLVTFAFREAGGKDLRHTHNSQALHDAARELGPTEKPQPGDLAFYGAGPDKVSHVAVIDTYGGVISADGATSAITSLAVSMNNPANRVRRHRSADFRKDLPYFTVRRFTLLDDLDGVSQ
jgi:cell wall-associated NlpC family hydrolase